MEAKSFLTSKTLWANALAVVAMLLKDRLGFDLSAEYAVAILGIVNLILRLVTRQPVSWS